MRTPRLQPGRLAACAPVLALALAGCGGGGDDAGSGGGGGGGGGSSNAPQQCAQAGNCPPSGIQIVGGPPKPLCAASLDYGTVFTGGSGAGEYLKMQFDTTARTYRLQIIESPVPKKPGVVDDTRAGVTFEGRFTPLTSLPTAEQNRCALQLQTAIASDGKSQALINPEHPPVIFVGHGVAGGGIPGATIAFDGILGLGRIPSTTFNIYPVLAFAQTEASFGAVAGSYNVLGYHQVPSGGALTGGTPFLPASARTTETLNPDGSCTRAGGDCVTTGHPWQPRSDGAFESNNADGRKRYPSFHDKVALLVTGINNRAKGILVVGKLNGAQVPLLIRVGYVNLQTLSIDDESGLALLARNTPLASGSLNGGYIGSGSDFAYTASIVKDNLVTLLDPLTMRPGGTYHLDFTQPTPGMVGTLDNSGTAGTVIASGGIFAHLAGDTFRVSAFASP